MPLETFVPPFEPTTESILSAKPRVNKAQFGDGYSQRSGDGLNDIPHVFPARWSMLWEDQVVQMEAFFAAHIRTPFLWGPIGTPVRKWIAVTWDRGGKGAGVGTLAATFEQVFDL